MASEDQQIGQPLINDPLIDHLLIDHPPADHPLIAFLKAIQASASIQAKLRQASDAEAVAIAEIAKEAGFEVPVEALKRRGRWWENLPQ